MNADPNDDKFVIIIIIYSVQYASRKSSCIQKSTWDSKVKSR